MKRLATCYLNETPLGVKTGETENRKLSGTGQEAERVSEGMEGVIIAKTRG